MSLNRAEADLVKLDGEMQRLRARIAALEDQGVKLRHYIEVAREYEGVPPTAAHTTLMASTSMTMAPTGSNTRAAVDTTIALLRERRQPMHTRVLLEALAQRGVNVGGVNPVANLSGFLSREKDRLMNSRLTGWSLKEWGEPSATQFGAVKEVETNSSSALATGSVSEEACTVHAVPPAPILNGGAEHSAPPVEKPAEGSLWNRFEGTPNAAE